MRFGKLDIQAGEMRVRIGRVWIRDGLHVWWGDRGVHAFWSGSAHQPRVTFEHDKRNPHDA